MAGITLAQAQAKLALWMAADDAVSSGQSYQADINGNSRRLTRANANEIQKNIEFWNRMCQRLSRGGARVRGITPID